MLFLLLAGRRRDSQWRRRHFRMSSKRDGKLWKTGKFVNELPWEIADDIRPRDGDTDAEQSWR